MPKSRGRVTSTAPVQDHQGIFRSALHSASKYHISGLCQAEWRLPKFDRRFSTHEKADRRN